jgi:hypothetical protein
MAGSSIFVTYGLKSGGGAPFLRRTRTAVGQLQTRTRTGSTSSQLQTRTRSCLQQQTPVQWRLVAHIGCMDSNRFNYVACPNPAAGCSNGTRIQPCATSFSPACDGNPDGPSYHVAIQDYICDSTTFFAYGGFSGWSATGSCSPTCPACWNTNSVGTICRECQTATICNFGGFSG